VGSIPLWPAFCEMRNEPLPQAMLNWTLTFLILALIVGVLGFSSLAGAAASIAQVLFVVFLVLLVISGFNGGAHGKNS
jgi:uncharacterized membrane protein YtjA (UPF0391 family)